MAGYSRPQDGPRHNAMTIAALAIESVREVMSPRKTILFSSYYYDGISLPPGRRWLIRLERTVRGMVPCFLAWS